MDQPQTIAEAVMRRADSTSIGLIAGDLRLTHAEVVVQAARRAAWLRAHRSPGPFHVAVLLDNVPEFIFWLEAAALAGAVVVGANPTHRGDELTAIWPHRMPTPGDRLRFAPPARRRVRRWGPRDGPVVE
jgi:fatty-acyl-CoA synthase